MSNKAKQAKAAKPKAEGDAKARIGPDLKAIHNVAIMAVQAQAVINVAANAKQGKGSVSQHLLAAAKTFPTLAAFKHECTRQEGWLKSDEGIAEVNRLHPELNFHGGKTPACWAQAKSNIVNTWLHEKDIAKLAEGFSLKSCKTESAMRQALNAYRKHGAASEPRLAVDRLSNVVRSLEKAHKEGSADAGRVVKDITTAIGDLTTEYSKILQKVLPVAPIKVDAKKAA